MWRMVTARIVTRAEHGAKRCSDGAASPFGRVVGVKSVHASTQRGGYSG